MSGPSVDALRAARAEAEFADVRKRPAVAYALWAGCGLIGGHRFYLGDTGRSIAMLFTFGGLGLWTLVDLFLIAGRVREVNRVRRAVVFARHGIVESTATIGDHQLTGRTIPSAHSGLSTDT
jgi:TM2 domain-containing membrane protein YozV